MYISTSSILFASSVGLHHVSDLKYSLRSLSDFVFLKMAKQRYKNIRLFFKLMLLMQIYCHHKFTVEAIPKSFPNSCEDYEAGDGTCIDNQISEKETARDHVLDRPKRPYRLLPLNNSL